MKTLPVHLGDLLRLLAQLPDRAEWAHAAAALGYDWTPPREAAAPEAEAEPRVGDSEPAPSAAPAHAVEPIVQADKQPLFWRIATDFTDASAIDVPDWLQRARANPAPAAAFESSGTNRLPRPQPLVQPGRLARFLRQQLAERYAGNEIDVAWAVRRLARAEPLTRLRRRERTRWPRQVDAVVQSHAALGPLRADLRAVTRQLQRQLGPRLRVLRAARGPHTLTDDRDRPATLRAETSRVLVLGDGCEYLDRPALIAEWQAWAAEQDRRKGVRPLLLAPLPQRWLSRATARAFDVALLDESARLQLRASAQGARSIGSVATEPQPHETATHGRALQVLEGLLAGISCVTPELLRLARRELRREGLAGADVACEVEFMTLPGVIWDGAFCRVLPQAEGEALAALPRLLDPATLRRRLTKMELWCRALSPVLRAERQQALATHLREPMRSLFGDADLHQAELEARQLWAWMAAALPRDPLQDSLGMAAYLHDLGRFNPGLVGAGPPELQAAWALATPRLFDAERPARIPEGVRLEALGWLAGGGAPLALELQAEGRWARLRLVPDAQAAPGAWLRGLPAATHAGLERVELLPERAQRVSAQRHLRVGEVMPCEGSADTPASRRWRLHVGPRRLDLESFHKPAWAEALWCEGEQRYARLPDGRLLRWVPQRDLAVASPNSGQPRHRLVHGCWWDDAEYRGFAGDDHTLRCPPWANAGHGTDQYGYWAAFAIAGVAQVMRFVQPGEFQMGSPEGEPGRSDDETQHLVLLTRGYWLADTACTQALWGAVVIDFPSEFNHDEQNPVECVSWDQVQERFLYRLRQDASGLNAVLPTEAQWEYAVRCAGSSTAAFGWGDTIHTDRANYHGQLPVHKPYAKGEYRGRTVPVRSFEPNALGLWQMAGNVWEWVQDRYDKHPRRFAVDPAGPGDDAGVALPGRVLRGGSWIDDASCCRSAARMNGGSSDRSGRIGFRLAIRLRSSRPPRGNTTRS